MNSRAAMSWVRQNIPTVLLWIVLLTMPFWMKAVGGYTERPLGTQLAPLSEIVGHNLPIAAQCLLLLPGADFLGLPAGASALFVALHLVGVAAAAVAIGLAVSRFGRRDPHPVGGLTSQLLAGSPHSL